MNFELTPGHLSFKDIRLLLNPHTHLTLNPNAHAKIFAAEKFVAEIILQDKSVYGINTGFGSLANTKISLDHLEKLQHRIILSHAAGTGELLSDEAVRLILLLKINSLARGYSGVRLQTITALIALFNANIYPCIPAQGSVGASGDLAPLAHMSAALLGVGEVRYEGKIISAEEGLKIAKQPPLTLAAKEGLALLNGTQVSTALAILSLLTTENLFITAIIAGALSVEATLSSDKPFDARIQQVRGHATQATAATLLRELLQTSTIRHSHRDCTKIQDPYSLRCQPQVMGACLQQILSAHDTLLIEANGVSDNPLIFVEDQVVISGGNFHAEPVAMAADILALSIAEIGSLSERRTALLMDPHSSGLPPFLVKDAGLNSGFMLAQVTAAALVSENKALAHPSSIDSIPTSANQEDHVSMATYAARRLLTMTENLCGIIGIELLAACQGIDFRRPLTTSAILETIHQLVREHIAFYAEDRFFSPDITCIKDLIRSGKLMTTAQLNIISA